MTGFGSKFELSELFSSFDGLLRAFWEALTFSWSLWGLLKMRYRACPSQDKQQLSRWWRLNIVRRKFLFQFFVNIVSGLSCVHHDTVASAFKVLYNWNGFILKSLKPFLDSLRVVIGTAGLFCTLHYSFDQDVSRTIKINEVSDDYVIWKLFLELLPVFEVSGKTVKEVTPVTVDGDTLFEQFDNKRWR